MGLINLFGEFGIGATIVARPELSDSEIAQLNSTSILAGLLCTLVGTVASYPISRFFSEPRLVGVVTLMSVGFSISSFHIVPYALLQRELRFKLLAGIEAACAVSGAAGAIILAAAGYGYWALVVPNVFNALLGSALTLAARRHRFELPTNKCLHALKFGSHIMITSIAWYTLSNADFLASGKILGQASTGAYVLAWYIASTPVEKITAMLSRVGPAVFSAVQHERSAMQRYLVGLSTALTLITVPLSLGLALTADDLINVGFGQKWHAAILPLRLLAVIASFRSITPLLNFVLNVAEHAKYAMWNAVFTAVILPLGFVIATRWGIVGVAMVWLLVFPLTKWPIFRRVFQIVGIGGREYMQPLWPAIYSCFVMSVAVMLLRLALPAPIRPAVRLTTEVVVGAAAYITTMLIRYQNQTRDSYQLLRRMLSRDKNLPSSERAGSPA